MILENLNFWVSNNVWLKKFVSKCTGNSKNTTNPPCPWINQWQSKLFMAIINVIMNFSVKKKNIMNQETKIHRNTNTGWNSPAQIMNPPACSILWRSSDLSGLWSIDKGTATVKHIHSHNSEKKKGQEKEITLLLELFCILD